MEKLFKIVSDEMGIEKEKLVSKIRDKNIVKARSLFIIFAREKLNLSFSEIGRCLKRDHTTILFSYNKTKNLSWIGDILKKYKDGLGEKIIIRIPMKGRYSNIYEKFDGKCLVCQFDEVVEIHHIVPKRMGGEDDDDNLVLLCPNHHSLADKGMLNIKDMHIKK